MAIKEIYIKGTGGENIMPSITQVAASGSASPSTPRVQTLQDWLDDFAKRRIAMGEYKKALAELAEEEVKTPKALVVTKEEKTKRYLVDSETGVITVDEENGEYNYRDAQLVSSSIKARQGKYDEAINLIKALKGDQSVGAETKRREWYVEDNGEIRLDTENGEYTLSEAREVSRSRLALIPREDNTVTKDKLELMKRDMKDEFRQIVSDEVGKVKAQLPSPGPKDGESPFTFDEKGELQINKGAKLGLMEMVVYNSLKAAQKQDRLFRDKDGTVMDLPSWLEMKKFEREEDRKDEMSKTVTGLIEMGRKELPGLISGIKNMATSKKAEEALEKGGWSGQGKAKSGTSEVNTAACAGCREPITYTTAPVVMACPKCHALNFIGTKEEFELIKAQLSSPAAAEGDTQADVHAETEQM